MQFFKDHVLKPSQVGHHALEAWVYRIREAKQVCVPVLESRMWLPSSLSLLIFYLGASMANVIEQATFTLQQLHKQV